MQQRLVRILSRTQGYELRREEWRLADDEQWCPITAAYTFDGEYLGGKRDADRLIVDRGIAPEKASPKHCVCSVGYSRRKRKWYGWSHRAICGFGVGYVVKKGSLADNPSGSRSKTAIRAGFKVRNLADARRVAVVFARGVS